MPGPSKKPSIIEIAQGRPGHRRINRFEPKPERPERCPPAPRHLDAAARKFWAQQAPIAYRLGLLTAADLGAFEMLCESYGSWRAAGIELAKSRVIETDKGYFYESPWNAISNRSKLAFLRIGAKFGLTPSDRTHLQGNVDEIDEGEAFFSQLSSRVESKPKKGGRRDGEEK